MMLPQNYPRRQRQLQRWIGLCNWKQKFINQYALLMAPFQQLLKKDQKWLWTETHEQAFLEMKIILINSPVLVQPNFNKPFYIVVDASTVGVAGYLGQGQIKEKSSIRYTRRILKETERKYSITER